MRHHARFAGDEAAYSVAPFPRFLRFLGVELIQTFARMCVEHGETRILAFEMRQKVNQKGMFDDVGEISGVKCVAVIHAQALRKFVASVTLCLRRWAETMEDRIMAWRVTDGNFPPVRGCQARRDGSRQGYGADAA
ncbi:hypothetical protein DOFOFD_07230 [Acetobacteraceae bacterium EV16P]|uniref:Uncharacterized protein n=1 Tax=Sorlinia euscelidii TaxID=3081148 RepID=A0ABU7U393_9PROT